jgi:ribose transport system substrate-binding protein
MDDLVAGGAAGIMVSAIDPKTQTEALDKVASQAVLATTDSDAPQAKELFIWVPAMSKPASRPLRF